MNRNVHRTMNRRTFGRLLLAAAILPVAGPSAGAGEDAAGQCARLRRRIDDLRLKLRMGYTARQGRQWRSQRAGLEAEWRQRCR